MLERSPVARAPTRVAAVMASLKARIESRALAPGARLPSVRALASALAVSKTTVVEAYERLVAEGEVTARRGAGFFVAGPTRPLVLAQTCEPREPVADWLRSHRAALAADPDVVQPGSGWLPESWMPEAGIQRALRDLARDRAFRKTHYDSAAGYEPLRRQLAVRLGERGVVASPEQIVLTDSTTQAIDLAMRFLVQPGDVVAVDDPSYFRLLPLLKAHRVEVVAAPLTPEGPDVEALGALFAARSPRLYLTVAAFHNPTGLSLSPAVAHRILKLVERHQVVVIEDEIFADFESGPPGTRLAAFDGLERVIQVGSYSKTVSAALRCGYLALRPDWVDPVVDLKLATALSSGHFAAAFLHRMLTEAGYRRHLGALRTRLADAMGRTLTRLRTAGLTPWIEPRGGVFLWARLPDGLDATAIARLALAEGVGLAPGPVFSAAPDAHAYLRFNAAASLSPHSFDALERAMANPAARMRR
ncbi:MAG: PLP-dependent aminotransferase family protein [Roseiarcus sp.]|jgi:DNA-binding transcriptional MocR family regulator|uniref:aminotransferase-like domain-containing protein n=1 Tax=Roseiarcus sp. TaxID=1969460 RepID=UPI003C1C7BD2